VQFTYQRLEPGVLLLQLLEAPGLVNLQPPPVFAPPALVALVHHTGLAAGRQHILALGSLDLDLPQLGHNLLGL